jgi:hypothetical protein
MQVTGILKNKARILDKVIYLDVAERSNPDGPKKQWILFKDKHTMQDIKAIASANPGSYIMIDGKDNLNKLTGQHQIVVHNIINIVPEDAVISNEPVSMGSFYNHSSDAEKQLEDMIRQMPTQEAISLLFAQILKLNKQQENK